MRFVAQDIAKTTAKESAPLHPPPVRGHCAGPFYMTARHGAHKLLNSLSRADLKNPMKFRTKINILNELCPPDVFHVADELVAGRLTRWLRRPGFGNHTPNSEPHTQKLHETGRMNAEPLTIEPAISSASISTWDRIDACCFGGEEPIMWIGADNVAAASRRPCSRSSS